MNKSTPIPGVYALCHPQTLEIRYIGHSQDMWGRLRAHMADATKPAFPVHWWIQKLGECPRLLPLECNIASLEQRCELERWWIAHGKRVGLRLLNVTAGGEGRSAPLTDKHRAAISAKNKGRKRTAEQRARMSAAHNRQPRDAETQAKITAALRGRPVSQETREKLRIANIGKKLSDETRAKISAVQTGKKRGPRKTPVSDETRAKMSATKRANPREYSAEERAARSARMKGQPSLFLGRKWSDEHRAKFMATMAERGHISRPGHPWVGRVISSEAQARVRAGQFAGGKARIEQARLEDLENGITREVLYRLYAIEGLTHRQIGALYGHSQSWTRRRCRDYGIPVRSQAESNRLRSKTTEE